MLSVKNKSKLQYYTILEQLISSSFGFFAAILVVHLAGVESLGVFSFCIVFVSLGIQISFTLFSRQMTLEIAELKRLEQLDIVLATTIIICVFALLVATLSGALIAFIFFYKGFGIQLFEVAACGLYIIGGCFQDAFKQYMYVSDNHFYSLQLSLVYAVALCVNFACIAIFCDEKYVVALTLVSFPSAIGLSLLLNKRLKQELGFSTWHGWYFVGTVFKKFIETSRFGLGGLLVTWVQNQSITPFLMYLSGPIIVGYFNLARLLVMPVSIVNQGIIKSVTPHLRRTYKKYGYVLLRKEVQVQFNKSCLFVVLYLCILTLFHFVGLLDTVIPDYSNVQAFLVLWGAFVIISTHRLWLGQYLMVTLRFKYMMFVIFRVSTISVLGMSALGLGFGSAYLAFLVVIFGEVLLIWYFGKKQRSDCC